MLDPGLIAWFKQRCDRLVAEALEYHEGLEPLRPAGTKGRKGRRAGHNLASLVRHPIKLCMKVSGAFRSEARVKDFATVRNVPSTARKQGRNRIGRSC